MANEVDGDRVDAERPHWTNLPVCRRFQAPRAGQRSGLLEASNL
jgi:hypothetical protein